MSVSFLVSFLFNACYESLRKKKSDKSNAGQKRNGETIIFVRVCVKASPATQTRLMPTFGVSVGLSAGGGCSAESQGLGFRGEEPGEERRAQP